MRKRSGTSSSVSGSDLEAVLHVRSTRETSQIAVTGAAGFIGSHTVDRLLKEGHRVTAIDNLRTGRRENLTNAEKSPHFEFVEADVSKAGTLTAILEGKPVSAIIHLAALVSVQESINDPDLNFQLNVLATHEVANAARRQGIKRVVFASSAAIYGNLEDLPLGEEARKEPISPYGAAKLASEEILHGAGRTYGFTTICQRYFNVFGPRQDPASPYSGVISIFHKRYSEGKPVIIFGDGRQSRDFISVYDVARANVLAATNEDLTSVSHNICTGRSTTLQEIVEIFAAEYPEVDKPQYQAARSGDIVHSCGNPVKARKTLGFIAEIDVPAGLRELISSAQSEH